MKTLTIQVFYPSLGDHLLHSHLPRCAKESGEYDKVFISNHSNYADLNIRRLVWEYNPYIDGFNDIRHPYPTFVHVREGWNLLDEVLDYYNLPDDGCRFREPEVYYQPKDIVELKNTIIFEPNHKNPFGIPTHEQTNRFFSDNKIALDYCMSPLYKEIFPSSIPKLNANTLEELCDVIHSCKHMYCYTSGVVTLAAALGKPVTVLYVDGIDSRFHHSKLHEYVKL